MQGLPTDLHGITEEIDELVTMLKVIAETMKAYRFAFAGQLVDAGALGASSAKDKEAEPKAKKRKGPVLNMKSSSSGSAAAAAPALSKELLEATPNVAQAPADLSHRPVVVGLGPCGLFAALILAQMGFKPIVLERGKEVRERTKDTFGFWRKKTLNPESNVQFGEGGAGTFSDGKLYSQVKDRKHYGRKVLHEFVAAGAPEEIMYVSKPHIGTFKLVNMVEKMRKEIIALGGEFRFSKRVEKLDLVADGKGHKIKGLHLSDGDYLSCTLLIIMLSSNNKPPNTRGAMANTSPTCANRKWRGVTKAA